MRGILRGILRFIFCFLLICGVIIGIKYRVNTNNEKNNNNNIKEKNSDTQDDSIIDEETYAKLIEELSDSETEKIVMDHLDKGRIYGIQKEIEYNGMIYRSIQMSNLEYDMDNKVEMLREYYSKNEEIKAIIDEQLKDDKVYDYDVIHNSNYREQMAVIGAPSVNRKDIGGHINFKRYDEFGFINQFIITALLCYDNEGKLVDVKACKGATGLELRIKEETLFWEVYISEEADYYFYGEKGPTGNKSLSSDIFSKGTVYDVSIDSNNNINDIKRNRESIDNECYGLTCYAYDIKYQKAYIKKYDISIRDVIEWDRVKEVEEMIINNKKVDDNTAVIVKDVFGKETVRLKQELNVPKLYYVMSDGYIIKFGYSSIGLDNEEYKTGITYVSISFEDFLNIEDKLNYFNNNQKPLFVNEEVNPELVKELEKQ